jgi:transcriptional regulator with XRE-family HTH domain
MTATPEPGDATVLPEVADDEAAAGGYQHRLGVRLRAVRRARGLRLQDVEELSEGRFKAVVVGSYERGDRAVSAHKLASLAAFYEVPVVELLPDEQRARRRTSDDTLAIDLRRLRDQADDPELAPLLRLVRHVQWLRDDYNGQILSLRADDLRTIAVSMGAPADRLDAWLEERELLHR